MSTRDDSDLGVNRRDFLKTTAAAALLSRLPAIHAGPAERGAPPATYHRISLSDPGAPAMLAAYQAGITAMLALPPTDPRNWYRNAFIHTMDCPHGNWWLCPWHRGYIGWVEQTIRVLSKTPSFAFPYWDWTAMPTIPPAFLQGVLNPSNAAYISNIQAFQTAFTGPMNTLWNSFTAAQRAQLTKRGFNSMQDIWNDVTGDPMFFASAQARTNSGAFDAATKQDVSQATLTSILSQSTFTNFGSGKAAYHSARGAFSGILEAQPHNQVHNFIGGFMQDLLSPVDPLFFMHHSNIDRIWTIWTAKQKQAGKPYLPTGADLKLWSDESFLFYINSAGKPVTQNTAGAYADIGAFDYDYTPGSGAAQAPILAARQTPAAATATGTVKRGPITSASAASAQVRVAAKTLEDAAKDQGPELVAQISIQAPAGAVGSQFHVFVNPPADAATLGTDHTSFAGDVSLFGKVHDGQTLVFNVALSPAIKKLAAAKLLKTDQPLEIQVAPIARARGVQGTAPQPAHTLRSASIGVA